MTIDAPRSYPPRFIDLPQDCMGEILSYAEDYVSPLSYTAANLAETCQGAYSQVVRDQARKVLFSLNSFLGLLKNQDLGEQGIFIHADLECENSKREWTDLRKIDNGDFLLSSKPIGQIAKIQEAIRKSISDILPTSIPNAENIILNDLGALKENTPNETLLLAAMLAEKMPSSDEDQRALDQFRETGTFSDPLIRDVEDFLKNNLAWRKEEIASKIIDYCLWKDRKEEYLAIMERLVLAMIPGDNKNKCIEQILSVLIARGFRVEGGLATAERLVLAMIPGDNKNKYIEQILSVLIRRGFRVEGDLATAERLVLAMRPGHDIFYTDNDISIECILDVLIGRGFQVEGDLATAERLVLAITPGAENGDRLTESILNVLIGRGFQEKGDLIIAVRLVLTMPHGKKRDRLIEGFFKASTGEKFREKKDVTIQSALNVFIERSFQVEGDLTIAVRLVLAMSLGKNRNIAIECILNILTKEVFK